LYNLSDNRLDEHPKSIFEYSLPAGSIARSASLPVFSLLRGRFEVFRPAGATRCTDGGEIWRGGGIGATTRV